jgi:cytochrome P450
MAREIGIGDGSSGMNLYSDEAILDPYPHYAAMRALGPLVYLPLYDIYAIPRYAEVKKALLAHNDFVSGHGVAGFTWPEMFQVKNVLASDEPDHSRLRQVMGAPLAPPALGPLTEQIESAAEGLIVRLIEMGDFDGMADFASFLPVSIVSSLVGLPEQGRDRMLDWAAASFDMLGVGNDRGKQAFEIVGEMINYVMTECNPDTVKPGGWAAQIWEAVQSGKLTPMEAGILHIDILAPALDTTIFATGHLLNQLATNPDQWAKLKADPSLIPAAIDEVVRLESPIRAFGRVVDVAQDVGGLTLPAGARVLMMYASANRDDRKWDAPENYNIERAGLVGHLGFGHGRHVCVGMHLARLEMRALFKAIVARVDRIEVGEPVLRLNNVLRGFASLPARFVAKG